jgi:hypothetical protein
MAHSAIVKIRSEPQNGTDWIGDDGRYVRLVIAGPSGKLMVPIVLFV